MDLDFYNKDLVQLPNAVLYPFQKSLWSDFNRVLRDYPTGLKLLIAEVHRRGGKDILLIQMLVKEAVKSPGVYLHVMPLKTQARSAIFESIDADGRRLLDYIPHQLIHKIREQDMTVWIKTDQKNADGSTKYSTITFTGSDSDSKVGGSYRGVVLSEYALCNPKIYYFLEPAVARNSGWFACISTPRGELNHMVDLINNNLDNPKAVIVEQLGIDKTCDWRGNPLFSREEYEKKIEQGVPEETAMQEYYCSRVSASAGAYYSKQFKQAYAEDRIGEFEDIYDCPAYFSIDPGFSDECVVWVYHKFGKDIYVMDCYVNTGEAINHYIDWIIEYCKKYRCTSAKIFLGHDVKQTERGSGESMFVKILQRLRFVNNIKAHVIPKTNNILDDINYVRECFSNIYFNTAKCHTAIQMLKSYTKKENKTTGGFDDAGSKPLHDTSSNFADSFRYGVFGLRHRY